MKLKHMLELAGRKRGELLLIHQHGEAVAGSFIVYEDGAARLFSEGVLNADKSLFRQGIGAAIYIFSFQHLIELGFDKVNLGRTRAFISDGVFYFKRRFGLRVKGFLDKGIAVRKATDSHAARRFLATNPFIEYRNRELSAAVFGNGESVEEVIEGCDANTLKVEGLGTLHIYDSGSELHEPVHTTHY